MITIKARWIVCLRNSMEKMTKGESGSVRRELGQRDVFTQYCGYTGVKRNRRANVLLCGIAHEERYQKGIQTRRT